MVTRYSVIAGCQLLLITNRKSHTGFRLVSISMSLNDLERLNSPYFVVFFTELDSLQAHYVTVVEDRPIMSLKYCYPVPVFHFWPKLSHPAARSLCDYWVSCYHFQVSSFTKSNCRDFFANDDVLDLLQARSTTRQTVQWTSKNTGSGS